MIQAIASSYDAHARLRLKIFLHPMAHKYIFQASYPTTPNELHCLWATLTDKAYVNQENFQFRVESQDKTVVIVSPVELPEIDVALRTNEFVFIRKSVQEAHSVQEGQLVHLQGEFAYSLHCRDTNKDRCPVNERGQIDPELKARFLAYLSRVTGLDTTGPNVKALTIVRNDISRGRTNVWLNDVLSFNIISTVKNAETVNRLAVSAIGRRKSYGLGNTTLIKV